jgi:hypothetical protein
MSYCVNCGVSLDKSEERCPLCGVPVINPKEPYNPKAIRPYPSRLDPITERINRRFIGSLISIALAFPAILCVAINYSLNNELSWSLYVMGALILTWAISAPVFFLRKRSLNRLFFPAFIALLLFLLMICALQGNRADYLPLFLPLAVLPSIFIYFNLFLVIRRLIHGFVIPAVSLISVGLIVIGIEWIIEYNQGGFSRPYWSLYVFIPCLGVAAVFLAIARKQAIHDEIKRRLHV